MLGHTHEYRTASCEEWSKPEIETRQHSYLIVFIGIHRPATTAPYDQHLGSTLYEWPEKRTGGRVCHASAHFFTVAVAAENTHDDSFEQQEEKTGVQTRTCARSD